MRVLVCATRLVKNGMVNIYGQCTIKLQYIFLQTSVDTNIHIYNKSQLP